MADIESRLDEAIERLNAGADPGAVADPELRELLDLARAVRTVPAAEWPDATFPVRLASALADELAREPVAARRPRRPSRVRLGLAFAAVVAVAVATAVSLERSPGVTAAALAREAIAASSGNTLGPVSFTQTIVNTKPPSTFTPAPPPPTVVERVTFASPSRWRVEATVEEPYGEGAETILTVRNGSTIVTVVDSPAQGKTETRRRAIPSTAGLPGAAVLGAAIDPLTLLSQLQGRCARIPARVQAGPELDGRPTQRLDLGPSGCPSADLAASDGRATFLVDRDTHIVLQATVRSTSGAITQRVTTSGFTAGRPAPPSAFRLPKPLPTAIPSPGEAALSVLLPADVPPGLHAGPLTPVETQASTGKLLAFTITYRNAAGRAELQLYEAAASTASVRFPGRKVALRAGLTGTYLDRNGLQILWWVEHGTYVSLQQGGTAAGVPLQGTLPLGVLRRVAASMR